jgi:hypothetical protein
MAQNVDFGYCQWKLLNMLDIQLKVQTIFAPNFVLTILHSSFTKYQLMKTFIEICY